MLVRSRYWFHNLQNTGRISMSLCSWILSNISILDDFTEQLSVMFKLLSLRAYQITGPFSGFLISVSEEMKYLLCVWLAIVNTVRHIILLLLTNSICMHYLSIRVILVADGVKLIRQKEKLPFWKLNFANSLLETICPYFLSNKKML